MYIQFHLKLGTNNLCFWLVNILLQKFDTLPKERNENDKNTNFIIKNNSNNNNNNNKKPRKYKKTLCNCFLWTHLTDMWCDKAKGTTFNSKFKSVKMYYKVGSWWVTHYFFYQLCPFFEYFNPLLTYSFSVHFVPFSS